MTRERIKNDIRNGYTCYDEMDTNLFALIDEIYDDFESRTCENCKHFTNTYYNLGGCAKNVAITYPDDNEGVEESFGCLKFERKQNEN